MKCSASSRRPDAPSPRSLRRKAVAALLTKHPELSNRGVAKLAGCDHHTVARERAEAEERGEIPRVETRTDSKGRAQPARRPAVAQPAPTPKAAAPAPGPQPLGEEKAELDRAAVVDPRDVLRRAMLDPKAPFVVKVRAARALLADQQQPVPPAMKKQRKAEAQADAVLARALELAAARNRGLN